MPLDGEKQLHANCRRTHPRTERVPPLIPSLSKAGITHGGATGAPGAPAGRLGNKARGSPLLFSE